MVCSDVISGVLYCLTISGNLLIRPNYSIILNNCNLYNYIHGISNNFTNYAALNYVNSLNNNTIFQNQINTISGKTINLNSNFSNYATLTYVNGLNNNTIFQNPINTVSDVTINLNSNFSNYAILTTPNSLKKQINTANNKTVFFNYIDCLYVKTYTNVGLQNASLGQGSYFS